MIVDTTPFNRNLICTTSVVPSVITVENVAYYDKDGFELTPLEIAYYQTNGIQLNTLLYNHAAQRQWVFGETQPGVIVDHSLLLERYAFGGDARDQLMMLRHDIPELLKLIATKSKWGFDFSVDYIADDEVTDLFHIEVDSQDVDQIEEQRTAVAKVIVSTDWADAAKTLRTRKSEWQHLDGNTQSDYKARFFGFKRALFLHKVI